MNPISPCLSIGLPVYNGEQYLEVALDSILAQSYGDFELVISSNGSTDYTDDICQEYAIQDRRIRYSRLDRTYPVAVNFNRVFHLATGKYFKWAAHDDICAPGFFQKCIDVLEQYPEVVLAYPKTAEINTTAQIIRTPEVTWKFDALRPHTRFDHFMRIPHKRCFEIFGVMRADVLRTTSLLGNFAGSDIVLLAELTLRGCFYEVPERLFLRRHHPGFYDSRMPQRYQRTFWFDPAKREQIVFPAWTSLFNLLRAIRNSPTDGFERLACYTEMRWWLRRHARALLEDMLIATIQTSHRWLPKLRRA